MMTSKPHITRSTKTTAISAIRLMLLSVLFLFKACTIDEDPVVSIEVVLYFPEHFTEQFASDVEVKIVNRQTGFVMHEQTNEQGVAMFNNPPFGIYDISVSETLTAERCAELIGIPEEVMLSAQRSNVYIHGEAETRYYMNLASSRAGDLVFKEIFYSGSRTPNDGTYYADQFMEIFNNSTEVIYVDGLLISDIMGNPSGPNPSPWRNDHDHVYAQTIWRIPGSGNDYPLSPGQSIVISQNGFDHREQNANSIDLSSPVSDFEYYVEREDGRDFDNPDVPNMILEHFAFMGIDYVLHVRGPGMIIWRCDEIDTLPRFTRPGSISNQEYVRIPVDMVIDGVEALADAEHGQNKRLPPSIDAGFIYCSGSYVNESIRRKVRTEIGGRIVLQDTNNSAIDFEVISPPTPKTFD